MRVSFHITGVGDADELCTTESLDILGSDITHTCTETSDKLVNHLREGSLVRHLSYDSLRYELLDVLFHILEIAVL